MLVNIYFMTAEDGTTYTEQLNVIKNMVVVREVVARDNVDAGTFLYPPVGVSKSLPLIEKLFL